MHAMNVKNGGHLRTRVVNLATCVLVSTNDTTNDMQANKFNVDNQCAGWHMLQEMLSSKIRSFVS